jgi:cytochrome P450
MSEIHIPNNTNIIIGILLSNRDPELWGGDALEWKPERWMSPLPDNVAAAHIPGVYSNM